MTGASRPVPDGHLVSIPPERCRSVCGQHSGAGSDSLTCFIVRQVNSSGVRRAVGAAIAMGDHPAVQVRDRGAPVGGEQEWQHGVNQAREARFDQ